jgi:hypothetical protein
MRASFRTDAIRPRAVWFVLAIAVAIVLAIPASAQDPVQGEILQQDLTNGQGITVLHVWGSHHDMGYAHGVLLADWVELAYTQMRSVFGAYWPQIRARVSGWTFLPAAANDEFQGILDGVREIHPETTMDLVDLKACCTFGDWSYSFACRSTSCWGDWVEPPFTTLSARKLQFYTLPPQITQQWHHVLCAWEPDDGTPAWVNFGFPGYASSVTGLNEYGTLASLHDWNSSTGTNWSDALPRTMACRWILTMDLGDDPMTHAQTAFDALHPYHVAAGGFVNYYVPDGGAGVIKSSKNQGFYAIRWPRPEYMDGQSISTNNSDIDGTYGIEPWDAYYQTLDPPAVPATMDGLWTTAFESTDMHIVEVGFRGHGDMAIWFAGRLQSGMGARVEWEWSDLFRDAATVDAAERPLRTGRAPYPNPAGSAEATLVFPLALLADAAVARLEIHDASGRLVRTLDSTHLQSAARDVAFQWDGRDAQGHRVPSGAYVCRLSGRREGERIVWIGAR